MILLANTKKRTNFTTKLVRPEYFKLIYIYADVVKNFSNYIYLVELFMLALKCRLSKSYLSICNA